MADESCPLLSLAAELRNRIWHYVVVTDYNLTVFTPYPAVPALLRSCRQARKEAFGIYLSESTFTARVMDWDGAFIVDTTAAMKHIQSSAISIGAVRREKLKMDYGLRVHGAPNWANLVKWLKASHEREGASVRQPTADLTAEDSILLTVQNIARGMKQRPWSDVLTVLESFHVLLARLEDAWV
ncbi:hypothetical protein LTR85_005093 [Meristemomyces frigidus]|nr:hypothetical protein LTR85_005093 [Meristemomyces frigidus]